MPHQTTSYSGMPHDEKLCKYEIQSLLDLKLIRPSESHQANLAFYVNKHSEQVLGKRDWSLTIESLTNVFKTLGILYREGLIS